MFVFGHTGLTVAAARAADRDVDPRWAAFLSLGPDLLDKPGSRLWPALVHHNTRGFGHTLLGSMCVLSALLLWKRRPKPALLLWACYAGHFVLDAMWNRDNLAILLWPLRGAFPPPVHGRFFTFNWLTAWYLAGELAGLILLARLARRHRLLEPDRLAGFLKSGRLT